MPLRVVEVILQRREVQDAAAAGIDLRQGGIEHPVHVARLDLARPAWRRVPV